METFDEVIREHTIDFIEKAEEDGQAVLRVDEPDAHARRHTPVAEKYEAMRTRRTAGASKKPAMEQMDDIIGVVMQKLKELRCRRQHDRRLHHRQRRRELHLAGWWAHAVRRRQGRRCIEGGFRVPCIVRWPGQVQAGHGRERHHVGARLVSDLGGRAGNPQDQRRAAQGQACSATGPTRCHLDGYDQMDMITGKGPSERHEVVVLR